MRLRIARHTADLPRLAAFYGEGLGLERLGSFEAHEGYDGVFLGWPDADWHLEFTADGSTPTQQPDDDDALVLYPETSERFLELESGLIGIGATRTETRNPYWSRHGLTFADPDGFTIVIVRPASGFASADTSSSEP